jgi:hypothetical protein
MNRTSSDENSIHTDRPRRNHAVIRFIFGGWAVAFKDLYDGLILPYQKSDKALKTGLTIMVSLVVTWFIYVPIHELLHVTGCLITGGSVSELIMGREYGADFLARVFPFITPASSQYAGRLTGFEPNGDAGYLITVFAPYILTLFPGVWCLIYAARTRFFWLFGPGIVLGLAPFYNLTGDYFEMGTILVTRVLNVCTAGKASSIAGAYWELRSDDLFRLLSEIAGSPARYGMVGPAGVFIVVTVVTVGLILAGALAGYTYLSGRWLAIRCLNRHPDSR